MAELMLPYRVRHAEVWQPGDAAERPPMASLPKSLPRRMSRLSRAVLSCVSRVAAVVGEEVLQYPVVYASRYGEIARTLNLFAEYEQYGEMSPAGFSVSVHNAPASLLGLVTGNCDNSTTLAAGEDTLRMGMFEAALRSADGPCLFVYGDEQQMEQEVVSAVAVVLESHSVLRPLPHTVNELLQQI